MKCHVKVLSLLGVSGLRVQNLGLGGKGAMFWILGFRVQGLEISFLCLRGLQTPFGRKVNFGPEELGLLSMKKKRKKCQLV